jgi:hypothetical protein
MIDHKKIGNEICLKINKVFNRNRLQYVGMIEGKYWFDFQFESVPVPLHKSFGVDEWMFNLSVVWSELSGIIEEEILEKV